MITLGLRRLASGSRYAQNLWNLTAPRTGAILQIPKQRDRARSSTDKAAHPADARIQAIRDGCRDDSRHSNSVSLTSSGMEELAAFFLDDPCRLALADATIRGGGSAHASTVQHIITI